MKKVLFVLDNLDERCGANVNIILNSANCLLDRFEIYALAGTNSTQPVSYKYCDIFKEIYTYSTAQFGEIAEFTATNWVGTSNINKIKRFVKKPKMFAYMVDNKYFYASITKRECKKTIEEICANNKFDIIIGVSSPYYIMQSISEANTTCRKMAIQLDPFTNNYTMPSSLKVWREKIEKKTIGGLDLILIADCAYHEMVEYLDKEEIKKIKSVPLPGITDVKCEICNYDNRKTVINEEENRIVDFIFTGYFYEDIRRPEYLLELFLYLPNNYRLHIVGGGCLSSVEKYQECLGNRLINHGLVSREEAIDFMNKADVLVNLNNTVLNQLPSKLLEYISTGKPILNICKSDKCLSLKYTGKYSNALDIIEGKNVENMVKNIIRFVDEKKGVVVDKDIILENFRENTNEYFAKMVEDNVRSLC